MVARPPLTESNVEELLPDIVSRLREALHPVAIYLFGSAARGTMGLDSDIDLLVIVAESSASFFERGAVAYKSLRGIPAPIDVQVYTREEFESRVTLPVSFERTVQSTGRLLYAA